MESDRRTVRRFAACLAPLLVLCVSHRVLRGAEATPTKPSPLLERMLAGPMAGVEEVVFAVRAPGPDPHWYANFAYWASDPNRMMYGRDGGKLCRLDLRTGEITVLLDDPGGGIRDPTVDYDGRTVLFSWRKGGTRHYNLYELRADADRPDGAEPRQVTRGPWDDIESVYLPNGDIVFASSRCKRWVSCWHTQVAVLYRADRQALRLWPISSNIEHDNTPAVLPDGRILYTRWEYVDRSQVDFHHLWTMNPDGTGQMTFFGNMHPRTVMIDAKPVPRTDLVAAIFSPGHGRAEHVGDLRIVDPNAGPDDPRYVRPVPGCPGGVRDPHAFSGTCFLVARANQLLLVDAEAGRHEVLTTLGEPGMELHEPWPLIPRPREPVVADRADTSQRTGRLALVDVAHGRNMDGVEPGEIRKLLVLETLPKPANFSGGPDSLTWLGTFNLERVLGTVPVEPDGSAHFELPANRPFFFVALDENDLAVKRMQSFTSVMPGETTSCVGCHERRTDLAPALDDAAVQALERPPSAVEPFGGFPDVVDFPRDVQPVLDRHCVGCHGYEKRAGAVVLAGDRGPRFSHSYWVLFAAGQVADGRNGYGNQTPRSIGSSASPLMKKVDPEAFGIKPHHDVKLSPRERRTIWLWIESGATYAGTYAALLSGTVGVPVFRDLNRRHPLPTPYAGACEAIYRRCDGCHSLPQGNNRPRTKGKVWLPAVGAGRRRGGAPHERVVRQNDPLARLSEHVLFNLTQPEKSPLLLGPLAKEAGGFGTCHARAGEHGLEADGPVFASTDDPDYAAVLAAIRHSAHRLNEIKRFDMPSFRPNPHYVREMKRFGILPASLDPAKGPIDVYATDRAYWRSLWWDPF